MLVILGFVIVIASVLAGFIMAGGHTFKTGPDFTGIATAKHTRMNVSLYQAASALNAMDRWQETIAENLAASSAPADNLNAGAPPSIDSALRQGALDTANTSVVNLICAPRAGEVNAKSVQADDEMMQLSRRLRR